MPHQIPVKERILSVCFGLRFETDNFKQSRYVGILIQAIIWRVYLCYDKSDK